MQKVFDAHVHLSTRKDDQLIQYARQNGLAYTLDELLNSMRENNVEHGLLLSPPLLKSSSVPNGEILELCERSSEMLSPVITVDPPLKKVKEAIDLARASRYQVRAFKIRLGYVKGSAESRVFDPAYDYAESENLPVLFHTGDTAFSDGDLAAAHPLTLDGLANKREKMRIVLCHFGNPWFEDVAEMLYKHPNVYADTSGLLTSERSYNAEYTAWLARKLSEAVYYVGNAEKIIFGTDYPVSKCSDAFELIRKLEISEEDKDKILYGNAQRVFTQ